MLYGPLTNLLAFLELVAILVVLFGIFGLLYLRVLPFIAGLLAHLRDYQRMQMKEARRNLIDPDQYLLPSTWEERLKGQIKEKDNRERPS